MCCANCRATEVCILMALSTLQLSKLQKLTLLSTSCLCKLVTLTMIFAWGTVICWVVQAICVQKKQLVFNTIVHEPHARQYLYISLTAAYIALSTLQAERSNTHKNCGIGGLKLILETQLKSLQRLLPRI